MKEGGVQVSNSKKQTPKTKPATPEQLETINDFVVRYSSELSKQLRQLDLVTQVSSNKGMYNPLLSEEYVNQINFNTTIATYNEIQKWLM